MACHAPPTWHASSPGATKPTYDIWGDTVNVASRLESSGVLGRIQVSEQVAQILTKAEEFEVECRGPIEVKGKGKLTTYLVRTPYDSVDSASNDAASYTEAASVDPPQPLEQINESYALDPKSSQSPLTIALDVNEVDQMG